MTRPTLTVALACIALCVSSACRRDASDRSSAGVNPTTTPDASTSQNAKEPAITRAKRAFRMGDYDAAAEHVREGLVSGGGDDDVTLLAARIEAARGKAQRAVDLLSDFDLEHSRLGSAAAELLVTQALKAGDQSAAESTLRRMIQQQRSAAIWRHHLWQLFDSQGRRQEASSHADILCEMGQASTSELISLIRRNEHFPPPKETAVLDSLRLRSPLARAKWHVARKQFAEAEKELVAQAKSDFNNPATAALYLRVLAEQQKVSEFRRVHAQGPDEIRLYADYWCAVGLFFIDQSEYSVATGLLLKAVEIDPTMRIAFQRLSRCFAALGRTDDGEQIQYRGTQLAQSETMGRRILEDSHNAAVRSDLAKLLLELGRPLEALEWTRTVIPRSAIQQHAAIATRRREIAALPDRDVIAATVALLEVDPTDFPYQDALDRLLDEGSSTIAPTSTALAGPPTSTPRLVNVAAQRKADFQWYHDSTINLDSLPLFESVGGGIAVLDYDLDGWPDLYFCQGSGRPPAFDCTRSSELRRNTASEYTVVTRAASAEDFHYSSGIAAGDVNQDGFSDLYLGALGKNRLLINNGDGTFRDATDSLPGDQDMFTSSLAIADVDGDHLPDLFEVNYIEMEGAFAQPQKDAAGIDQLPSPLLFFAQADRLFRAKGDGEFLRMDVGPDIAQPATGLGIIISDFDDDKGNELFIGNDLRPNHFLRFRDGELENLADVKGTAVGFRGLANGCMGIATGDFDRNGTFDLHVSNYLEEANNLFLQNTSGLFRDAAASYGLRPLTFPYVAFGTKAIDIDRNGWLDFAVTNGHIFDMRHINKGYQMPPQAIMGRGDGFQLVEVDDPSGYWGGMYLGRSMALIDFNRNGITDLVIGHLDAPTALLDNQTETMGQNVMLELVGTVSERDAVGAKVVVHAGDQTITQWVTAGDGYFCTDEAYLDISIAEYDAIDGVEVAWPSGTKNVYDGIGPNQRYLLIENEPLPYRRERP